MESTYTNSLTAIPLQSIYTNNLTEIPLGLSGQIFRGKMPYRSTLKNWEEKLTDHKIRTIVLLCSIEESEWSAGIDLKRWYQENGFEVVHMPIQDFSTPKKQELLTTLDSIIDRANSDKNVVIHCKAGIGRTGLVCACLARKIFGCSGEEAIGWIREFIPGAVETLEQEAYITQLDLDTSHLLDSKEEEYPAYMFDALSWEEYTRRLGIDRNSPEASSAEDSTNPEASSWEEYAEKIGIYLV